MKRMICALLITALSTAAPWRTRFTTEFRIDPTASNYVAAVSWKPHKPSELPDGPVVIDLIEVGSGKKKLITSTVVTDGVDVVSMGVHRIPGSLRKGVKSFDTWFLTASVNGGQFDTMLVWHFDPKSKRPKEILSVLMGDDSLLARGEIVENSFARYASPSELPKGVEDGPTNIKRTWRFDRKTFSFVAGKWRRS